MWPALNNAKMSRWYKSLCRKLFSRKPERRINGEERERERNVKTHHGNKLKESVSAAASMKIYHQLWRENMASSK
jgi:hypothetical protein